MIWAFVDYENIGSLEALDISEYEKMFVFCGPKNTRIKFGLLPSNDFSKIELIQVTTMGSNNLDFHIAFHLGRFHEIADENTAFHIVSNDAGFNGLVNHLKKIGRKSKKVSTKTSSDSEKVSSKLSDCASLVITRLSKLDSGKRPRKRVKFLNWIKSQCQGCTNAPQPEAVCEELIKAKIVQESESDVSYELGR